MISAFLNTVKIPELRRRILFTLAVVVVVRLGAAITTPGVNQAVLQEWFRSALTEKSGGNLAALLNPRFGKRRINGIWPPSKPRRMLPPDRAFWPL